LLTEEKAKKMNRKPDKRNTGNFLYIIFSPLMTFYSLINKYQKEIFLINFRFWKTQYLIAIKVDRWAVFEYYRTGIIN